MCSLEVLGLSDKGGNDGFHESFKENLKCLDYGSYSTRLPWKSDHCQQTRILHWPDNIVRPGSWKN